MKLAVAMPQQGISFNIVKGGHFLTRIVVGATLAVSAVDKALHPTAFANLLSNYSFIPQSGIGWWISLLVAMELLLALCMIFGMFGQATMRVVTGLLVIYTAFLVYSIATGNTDHGCGCFVGGGSASTLGGALVGSARISWMDVGRDLALLVINLVSMVTYRAEWGLDSLRRPVTRSYDLSNWDNRQKRSLYSLLLTVTCVIGVALGAVTQFVYADSRNSPLAIAKDFKPTGYARGLHTLAPDFNLQTISGQSYSLRSFRGHVVLLEMFALWCPHCQAEAPVLNQLDSSLSSSDLQVLSVISSPYGKDYEATGSTSTYRRADVQWFTSRFQVKHPILVDPNFQVTNEYLGAWYPTIYIIDRQGNIRYEFSGTTPRSKLISAIDHLE